MRAIIDWLERLWGVLADWVLPPGSLQTRTW